MKSHKKKTTHTNRGEKKWEETKTVKNNNHPRAQQNVSHKLKQTVSVHSIRPYLTMIMFMIPHRKMSRYRSLYCAHIHSYGVIKHYTKLRTSLLVYVTHLNLSIPICLLWHIGGREMTISVCIKHGRCCWKYRNYE